MSEDQLIQLQRDMIERLLERLLADRFSQASVKPKPSVLQVDVLQRLVFARQDLILVVKTGFGKSLIFHAWSLLTGKMSIIIVPLLGLADQTYDDFCEIPGANPIIVSKETRSQYDDIFAHIRKGDRRGQFTHLIMGPEQLASPDFRGLLRDQEFRERIGSLVIDEAHCVLMWSAFRSEYAQIHSIRPLLPPAAILFACTATLNPALEKQIVRDAGFGRTKVWTPATGLIRGSIDRPEIKLVVSQMSKKLPMLNILKILRLAIDGINDAAERDRLPLGMTVVFANSRNLVKKICGMIRDALRRHGYSDRVVKTGVKTYTSRTSKKDRANRRIMLKDPDSKLLIVVATSAFGMGMDIPHIQAIWQFEGLPLDIKLRNASDLVVCDLWQRGGRAARGHGAQGLFVILLEYNIAEKEAILQTRRLKKLVTSESRDRSVSGRNYTLTGSRRNSVTADPSRRNSHDSGTHDTAAYPDEEEDDTGEGISTALQVNAEEYLPTAITSESALTPKFSWSGLLAATCYRAFILTHLGESYCYPELRSESVDPVRCCNKCNPEVDLDTWMPSIPAKRSKIIIPVPNTPGRVFFQAVCDWADNEATRLYSGDDYVFDLKGSDFISKEKMIMLQRSVYHITDSKEIRFLEGPNNYRNLLTELRQLRPEIDSGVEERFKSFVKNDDIMSQLDRMDWGVQPPRGKPISKTTPLRGSSQSSQPEESSSLRQEVATQPSELLASTQTVPSISLQAQNDSLCRSLLRSNAQRKLIETGSQPSGLRYDMVVQSGSVLDMTAENQDEVKL
jgi:superfamily II DNA/RNA helicase